MYEVRFHGRGGQGAVMAAQALAAAAFEEGNYAVAFPFFGAERRGAPVLAFTRVDKKKIRVKTQVYEPNYVVVLDDSLIDTVNVVQGLKEPGMVVINTQRNADEIDLGKKIPIAVVDATGVALEVLGSPVTNSAILGAFAKATGMIKIESVKKGILDIFGPRIGEKNAEKNAKAAEVSYGRTTLGESKALRKMASKKQWLPTVDELPLGGAGVNQKTDAGLVGLGSFIENKTGGWRTFMPKYDQSKCTSCLFCWFYCPEGCISRIEKGIKIDYEYCKGCGICAEECPAKGALTMVRGD